MTGKIVLSLLIVAVWMQSAVAIQWLWSANEEYNQLCSQELERNATAVHTSIAMPSSACDVHSFIMCFNGKAIAKFTCNYPQRFNPTAKYCDFPEMVALPEGCSTPAPAVRYTSCNQGDVKLEVEGTCKRYQQCVRGQSFILYCQPLAYFNLESQACEYITEPYRENISEDVIAACRDKDPYLDADGNVIQ